MSDTRKVIVDGEEFEVEVERDGDTFHASVGGKTFSIEIPEVPKAAPKRAPRSGKGKKSGVISANIPGKVVTIEVSEGDEVSEGKVVLILEAMKMQNEITAPISGTVKQINCQEGQSIEANIPLMEIVAPPTEDEK
mgnify:FL=1